MHELDSLRNQVEDSLVLTYSCTECHSSVIFVTDLPQIWTYSISHGRLKNWSFLLWAILAPLVLLIVSVWSSVLPLSGGTLSIVYIPRCIGRGRDNNKHNRHYSLAPCTRTLIVMCEMCLCTSMVDTQLLTLTYQQSRSSTMLKFSHKKLPCSVNVTSGCVIHFCGDWELYPFVRTVCKPL